MSFLHVEIKSHMLSSYDSREEVGDILVEEKVEWPYIRSLVSVDKPSLEREESWAHLLQLIDTSEIEERPKAQGKDQNSLKTKKSEVWNCLLNRRLVEDQSFQIQDSKAWCKVEKDILEVKKYGVY